MDVTPEPASTRLWAEVNRAALRANASRVRDEVGESCKIIAVVKANAYGHGLDCVVPALCDYVDVLAVANLDEAREVQSLAPEKDVLILSPCLPVEREAAAASGVIVTISSADEARAFAACADPERPVLCVLKIDSGMGRIGVPLAFASDALHAVVAMPGIELHSVATHLPSADEDAEFTRCQLAEFGQWVEANRAHVSDFRVQILNSAGIGGFAESAYDFVRAGLALYGIAPLAEQQKYYRQALTWKTRVVLVRELPEGHGISYGRTFITPCAMRVATLAVGYADGYPRQVSGRGAFVLIRGIRCPLLGRVTMDQIVVDVSALGDVELGEEAVLLGSQGSGEILASEVATWAGTIAWHIFTGIGGRTRSVSVAC